MTGTATRRMAANLLDLFVPQDYRAGCGAIAEKSVHLVPSDVLTKVGPD